MKKISLFGLVLLFVSQLSFAGPVKITYDFFSNMNSWESRNYDGHLTVYGEMDEGIITGLSDVGTVDLAGTIFNFDVTGGGSHEMTKGWGYYIVNVYGTYLNPEGGSNNIWARYEGKLGPTPMPGGESWVNLISERPAIPGARLSVVDVPEPTPLILIGLGLIGLLVNRTRGSNQ